MLSPVFLLTILPVFLFKAKTRAAPTNPTYAAEFGAFSDILAAPLHENNTAYADALYLEQDHHKNPVYVNHLTQVNDFLKSLLEYKLEWEDRKRQELNNYLGAIQFSQDVATSEYSQSTVHDAMITQDSLDSTAQYRQDGLLPLHDSQDLSLQYSQADTPSVRESPPSNVDSPVEKEHKKFGSRRYATQYEMQTGYSGVLRVHAHNAAYRASDLSDWSHSYCTAVLLDTLNSSDLNSPVYAITTASCISPLFQPDRKFHNMVVRDDTKFRIRLYKEDKQSISVTNVVFATTRIIDIAILELSITVNDAKRNNLRLYKIARPTVTKITLDRQVTVVGYPHMDALTVSPGTLGAATNGVALNKHVPPPKDFQTQRNTEYEPLQRILSIGSRRKTQNHAHIQYHQHSMSSSFSQVVSAAVSFAHTGSAVFTIYGELTGLIRVKTFSGLSIIDRVDKIGLQNCFENGKWAFWKLGCLDHWKAELARKDMMKGL